MEWRRVGTFSRLGSTIRFRSAILADLDIHGIERRFNKGNDIAAMSMQPESLVKLVGSGNTDKVEEEWLALAESADVPPATLTTYSPVLAELARVGKSSVAEAMALMALDAIAARCPLEEALSVAGAFLPAVGESKELRSRVEGMYRSVYGSREGIDVLLKESGLAGARPVRRALRTLGVCVNLAEGDHLAGRDEETAARVTSIDRSTWRVTIDLGDSEEELGAVHLADRFEPAAETDFRVLKQLYPQRLSEVLNGDPSGLVIDLCRRNGGSFDSSRLESMLVPAVFSEDDWEKWWTKARNALRKCKRVRMEGRSPCYLSYVDEAPDGAKEFIAEFRRTHGPMAQLALVEKYVRDCKSRGEAPSEDALNECLECYMERAAKETRRNTHLAGMLWAVSARIARIAGRSDGHALLVELLRTAAEPHAVLRSMEDDGLADLAIEALVEARPSDWTAQLTKLLPYLPAGACDRAAARLLDAGMPPSDIESAIGRAMASPVECFEALLWLWDGPERPEVAALGQPVAVLTRILKALDECRRNERIPKETCKKISARARAVLSARRHERFIACLHQLDRGMAHALRVQISQLDNLGRAVHEDLLKHIGRAFPTRDAQPAIPPWKLEDTLYVTRLGLAKKHDEIHHHVNVKMRDNARAIGAAAEHGDLSENSEYKFALEERDLLRARLAQMNAEVASARVLSPSDVPTDHVGIGSRAVFRRMDDGKPYEMTFVGPWEADHARGWYNYRAPLAQMILGKRVGDVVDFDHGETNGRYEIVEIRNGLAELDQSDRVEGETQPHDANVPRERELDSRPA